MNTLTLTTLNRILAGLFVAAAAIVSGTAGAHQQHGIVTLDDLVRNSAMIVEGEVEAVTSQWNASRTQIHTTVRVFVDAYHKGGDGREVVEFRLLGGTVFDETLAIIGQPRFVVGERTVVFLNAQWEYADAPVVEMEHGKLTVGDGPPGRETLVGGAGDRYRKAEVVETIRRINSAGREAKR